MRYQFTATRSAIAKQVTSVGENVEKPELALVAGGKVPWLLRKTLRHILIRLNKDLDGPAIPPLGIYLRNQIAYLYKLGIVVHKHGCPTRTIHALNCCGFSPSIYPLVCIL